MRAFQSSQGRVLVETLSARRAERKPPPVLFLGAGCSVSSGCAATSELASHINSLLSLDKPIKELSELVTIFDDESTRLLLARSQSKASPSLGYRLLAQLIADGFFSIVVTANWDYLLEHELRRLLPPSSAHVLVRPAIADKQLSNLLLQLKDSPVLLRLHGDLASAPIVASQDLLDLDDSLVDELNQIFRERGVIFIGYSLSEYRVVELLKGVKTSWISDPIRRPDELLKQLKVPLTNVVTDDDALFDHFMEGLAEGLLSEALATRTLLDDDGAFVAEQESISALTAGIQRGLLANSIQDDAVEGELAKLLNQIKKHTASSDVGLLFVDDPSAPGGGAMLAYIKRTPALAAKVSSYGIARARIAPRIGSPASSRRVLDVSFEGAESEWLARDVLVIVDNVSFTGSTLEVVRDHLISSNVTKDIVAAVLRVDPTAQRRLEAAGLKILTNHAQRGSGFSCPWGVTRPTAPTAPARLPPTQIHFDTPLQSLDFLPESEFWFIPKPWGDVTAFGDNMNTSTRILLLERFHRTSLHYHLLRDEIFFGLDADFLLQLWDRYLRLQRHQGVRVPRGVPHRLIALEGPCRIVEVAYGTYEQRKDIFRLDDMYGRIRQGEESDGLE